jgi:uncharacterized protein YodC (DUF2158 family)
MAQQFEPGDLVMLKINKQKMTVKAFATKPTVTGIVTIEDRYLCVWFDGVKEQKAVFHNEALQLIAPYYDTMHFGNYE